MQRKVKIVADSTCDLNAQMLERYGIEVIPLNVNLGDKSYLDGVNIHTPDLFEYYNKTGRLPTTSAPTPAYYEDFYQRWTNDGFEVVHFSISSELTVTPNIAKMAAEKFDNIYPVDSRNVSSGMGILAVKAAELRDRGFSAKEIEEQVKGMTNKVRTTCVISTLLYMYKGGRCTGLQALGANLLNLKPCIDVKDGKMGVAKKYRGSLKSAVCKLVEDRLKGADNIDLSRLIIANYDVDRDTIEAVKEKIKEFQNFDEIVVGNCGCSVSVHCGPGTFALMYMVQ
nr:DegV family protein [uncultured Caproiciproducens sp.]